MWAAGHADSIAHPVRHQDVDDEVASQVATDDAVGGQLQFEAVVAETSAIAAPEHQLGFASRTRVVVLEQVDENRGLRRDIPVHRGPQLVGNPTQQHGTIDGLQRVRINDRVATASGRVQLDFAASAMHADEIGCRNAGAHHVGTSREAIEFGRVRVERFTLSAGAQARSIICQRVRIEPPTRSRWVVLCAESLGVVVNPRCEEQH